MIRFIPHALTLSLLMLCAAPALAQDDKPKEEPAKDAPEKKPVRLLVVEKTIDGGEVVIIKKMDGWVFGEAPKGSLAMLRAAGEESSQLEVRYTPNIQKDKLASHLTSFHSSLKQMGLSQVSTKNNKFSEIFPEGVETEYSLTSNGKKYRLIVWSVHRKDGVWFVTGFFPEQGRDARYTSFSTLIQSIQFK